MFRYHIGFKLKTRKKQRKSFKNATSPVTLRRSEERIHGRLQSEVLKGVDVVVPCEANAIGAPVERITLSPVIQQNHHCLA